MLVERPLKYMEEWSELHAFPGYSVSHWGRVRNDRTNYFLTISVNQLGIPYVGLKRDGISCQRAVAPMVARAFLPPPELPTFDTPINLDGDRLHNAVENLVWRPRWFAVKYHRQFHLFYTGHIGVRQTIEDRDTEERFETSAHASIKFGLLDREVMFSVYKETYVWPTYQTFRIVG